MKNEKKSGQNCLKIKNEKNGQNCPEVQEEKIFYHYTLSKNVKSGNDSYRSKYTRLSFFLYNILILFPLKIHDLIFLLVFIQISESAIEIKFSLFSDKNSTFFPRILELRVTEGIFDISIRSRNNYSNIFFKMFKFFFFFFLIHSNCLYILSILN